MTHGAVTYCRGTPPV